MRLCRLVSLGAKVGSGRATLGEETGEDRLEEGTEDDLGATVFVSYKSRARVVRLLWPNLPGLRESHPQNEDKLEGVVEGCCS